MKAYFTPPNMLLTVLGLSLATFMQVLDTTIANVSLPTIAGNLGVSVDQSTWVITSFAVSQAIGLPLTGYLSRRFGEVKVFVWCTFLFVLTSFACGIAQGMTELIIIPLLLSFFVGKYAARMDMRMLASIAFIVMSGVSFLYSTYNLEVSYWNVAFAQLLMGIGVTFFFMPVLTILISDLEPREIASGSGVASFLRVLGGSFAASIITSAWDHRASYHHARLAEHITPYDIATQNTMAALSPDNQAQALGVLNQIITQQSFQISFNEIYYVLGWVFLTLIAITWLAKPPFIAAAGKAPVAAEH